MGEQFKEMIKDQKFNTFLVRKDTQIIVPKQ